MPRQPDADRTNLLQGTLDLLVLRTLALAPAHGQGIARAIQQYSRDSLLVEHGSLYPALQRLELRGWISAEWGVSENNRRARFYSLTRDGSKQLVKETSEWNKLVRAVAWVLDATPAPGA